jgi:hypothetical protein
LRLGLDPFRVKPRSCSLWPLSLSDGRPSVLSVCDDVFDFPCNRRRSIRAPGLDRGVGRVVEIVLGSAFRTQLERAVAAQAAAP